MFRRKYLFAGILCVSIIVLPTLLIYAAGLRVGPSEVTLKNVPVGILYDFQKEHGIFLKIYNDFEESQIYTISSLKSSEINNVPEDYDDIPDANWLYFETNEIEIEANGTGEVKMYLNIPDDEKYYGQFWVVSIRVKSIPKMGQGISLACHPRIKIETLKSKASD